MSRKNKGQSAPLKENEAYIAQDSVSGEYRLMRDDFGAQSASASPYTQNYVKPRVGQELTTELPESVRTAWKWARWGTNDKYPHDTIAKLAAVPIAGRAINDLIKLAYGEGISYEKETGDPDDITDTDVEIFLKGNKPHKILRNAYGSYYRHNCVFAVYTLDGNGKICKIETPDPAFCRLAVQDEESLRVEALLYSKKFGSNYTPRDEDIIAIPLLDEWDNDAFFKNLKVSKFAMMVHGESPAMLYYPVQPWAGLLKENGWLDVSADVPRIMAAMQKNQVNLKYKIGVDEDRFTQMYGDGWRRNDFEFEGKNKKQLRDEYWAEIEKLMSGPDNAGKSIKYLFKSDPMTGRIMGNILIEPIDDKMKTGQWIPNSQAADQQIVQALGVDASMIGLQGMDTALGGNSGSNKRVGYNQAISMNTLDQETVLEIYNFVSEFNGWGVCFYHEHMEQTTINEQESGLIPPK
jgi:hypothetical protein